MAHVVGHRRRGFKQLGPLLDPGAYWLLMGSFFRARVHSTEKTTKSLDTNSSRHVPNNSDDLSDRDIGLAGPKHNSEANRHPGVWTRIHPLGGSCGFRDGRACRALARCDPDDYGAVANRQGKEWVFPVPLSLCCVAPLLESIIGAFVDEEHPRFLLLSACLSSANTVAMCHVGSCGFPASAAGEFCERPTGNHTGVIC